MPGEFGGLTKGTAAAVPFFFVLLCEDGTKPPRHQDTKVKAFPAAWSHFGNFSLEDDS